MISRISFLLFCGIILTDPGDAQKLPKVKKLNMKAHINITGDTLTMKFHRPNQNIKLEGFILGYGSNYFSNQYIQWPDNGKSYITDVDAETRYLIAVKPNENPKKSCKDKNSTQKPLQLVIGTLTPTSVFLSWGILINPQIDWSALSKCPNGRFYTIRYREKNKDWNFQLCPTTETVIDNLKPNTLYEFGVTDNSEDEIWSKSQSHKTNPKGKENGNLENTYKIPKGTLQYATEDTKAFIPITKVKQGFQNITKPTPLPPVSKVTESPPVSKASEKSVVEESDLKPVAGQPIVESFTPDSSTGTLEWVRATMVTHPFFQVTNLPVESSATDEHTASLAVVRKSNGKQDGSEGIATLEPVLTVDSPRDLLETPPISQQGTMLPPRIIRTTSVYPVTTDAPQVRPLFPLKQFITPLATTRQIVTARQSTMSSHTRQKTSMAFAGGQNIHTTYESIARTEEPYSVSATATKFLPAKQRTWPPRIQTKTTTAFTGGQHISTTYESITRTEVPHSVSAITSQTFPDKQSTLPSPARTKIKTVFPGRQHISTTQDSNIKPEDPYSILVPNETASFHPKPFPSTEAPSDEADSTQPNSEISTTEAPHTYEPETFTLASNEKKVVQKFSSTSKPKPTTASKKTRVSPMQYKTPLPEKTHPTAVLKDMQPIQLIEETSTIVVPTEIQKLIPKKAHSTESPSLPVDPSTSHILPIDDLGVDIFEHTKRPLEPNKTEKASTPKFDSASKSPTTSTVVTSEHIKPMPIYLISLQIFADPTVASEKTEIQTTPPPIPKTPQSNKMLHSKPVPNTAQRPYQPTTQKPESPPHSKPVPTQKVSTPTIKKPKPTPRIHEEPASTGAPKDTPKPSYVNQGTTLVPYRLQHSSSRPKTSFKPRTRPPAHNGTTQGPIRSRPTGEFNWLPGTVPGGKIHDNTKILGVRRNISMETNNTGKRTFSVSSPPLPPVRPTSIRRRIHPSNVTGRPGFSVSSPPLLPVRPTAIRRKPPTANVTGKPEKQGGNLIPRAPSAAKPECAVICIKSPMKQPTLPDQEEDLVPSTVFSTAPKSDIDALGKTRYTNPHVLYMSKNESVPCSITDTLKHFSTEEESTNQEVTSAPQNPPTNLTVYTVEGCSSFVVLNWEKPDNDTVTEYDVISKENGGLPGKDQSIITTNQTHSTVENLKPDTSYEFQVIPKNPLGEGPSSAMVEFNTESADPRVSEPVTGGKDAIWTEIKFKADFYSDCKGKQYVKRTWYKKFVGIQLCNSLRYKIYLSDSLSGTFYNVGDQSGFGEDHCQFVDSFLEGRTGEQLQPYQLTAKKGFYRSVRQQPVEFGEIGGQTHISYVHWYECGISIPGKW
ncbi:target of Nesh-SH3 isoform X5 [Ranitomeya variabilis]|uniref:target of Nesh-SH3 isoform X5 n=1 Tax=Ranitomeya variabilis TaxID=490064 RepID=UPI004056BECD